VALVRKRTIPTERLPHVGEVSANFRGYSMSRHQRKGSSRPLISIFYTRIRYVTIHVATQLHSRGRVDPVPDPLHLRKCGSAENRSRDICICSQELWALDHRWGLIKFWNALYSKLVSLPVHAHWSIYSCTMRYCSQALILSFFHEQERGRRDALLNCPFVFISADSWTLQKHKVIIVHFIWPRCGTHPAILSNGYCELLLWE
jgi:hypothetical protein